MKLINQSIDSRKQNVLFWRENKTMVYLLEMCQVNHAISNYKTKQ
jgi:hypothetical protein